MTEPLSDSDASEPPQAPPSRWRRAAVWAERLLTAGLLVFVAVRLGPQLGAWTGVGPTLGTAPAFTATTLDGRPIDSADLAGKVVVVNFWATWCGPCRLEMPALQAVAARHPDEVVVLGLSVDGGPGPVGPFLAERGITYPVAMATHAQRRAFGGIPGIPTTFLIDRKGVLRHRVVGYFAPPALNTAVARLVEEGAVPE